MIKKLIRFISLFLIGLIFLGIFVLSQFFLRSIFDVPNYFNFPKWFEYYKQLFTSSNVVAISMFFIPFMCCYPLYIVVKDILKTIFRHKYSDGLTWGIFGVMFIAMTVVFAIFASKQELLQNWYILGTIISLGVSALLSFVISVLTLIIKIND